MITIAWQCPTCHTLSPVHQLPRENGAQHVYFRQEVMELAKAVGWSRKGQCPACRDLPPPPQKQYLATLHCDHCGEKTFAQKLIFKNAKERFIWKTRKQARAGGWRHLSLKKDRYQDYCPACAGVRMNSGEHRDLLRLVWRTSTVRVAAEMGLSDKALEKRCKRAHVPKPPRGFWAKYDAGYFASCRALIPPEVQAELGQAYLDEYYPV